MPDADTMIFGVGAVVELLGALDVADLDQAVGRERVGPVEELGPHVVGASRLTASR